MKKIGLLFAVAGAVLAIRRFGPEMGQVCECVFDKLPESFPPKKMFLNLQIIREQNERILKLLEKRAKSSK